MEEDFEGPYQTAFLPGPDWRWMRAHNVSVLGPKVRGANDDKFVAQAKAFLAETAHDAAKAEQLYPHVAAAVVLWADVAARRALELLTLADCSQGRIAERLDVKKRVVTCAERLFFDVRRRRQSVDWIHCHVVEPYRRRGEMERAIECEAALCRGISAAEAILDNHLGVLGNRTARLAARQQRLELKYRAALDVPLTAENSLQMLRIAHDYELAAERLELDKKKFAHACQRARQQQLRSEARQDAVVLQRQLAAQVKVNRAAWDQLKEAQAHAEASAAAQRAAASPLADLQWRSATQAAPPLPAAPPPVATREARAAARSRRYSRRPASRRKKRRQLVGAS